METIKLTIRLPGKHVEFAKAYDAKAHGITLTEFYRPPPAPAASLGAHGAPSRG